MGYIVVTRNPKNRKLIVVRDTDTEDPEEFETEDAAATAADGMMVCRAWGYQVLEIE